MSLGDKWRQVVGSKYPDSVSLPCPGAGGNKPRKERKEVATTPWAGMPLPGRTQSGKCGQ